MPFLLVLRGLHGQRWLKAKHLNGFILNESVLFFVKYTGHQIGLRRPEHLRSSRAPSPTIQTHTRKPSHSLA